MQARRPSTRAALFAAAGVLVCASFVGAASPPDGPPGIDSLPPPEQTLAPGAKAISLIDSRTVQCAMTDPRFNLCEMRWQYLYVSAGSLDYVTFLTVTIDGRTRAISTGFFQTAMYIPFDMFHRGFKVECGELGSGGAPDLGMAHTYYIEAHDTTGTLASNLGAVICPSILLFEDGFETGTLSAWSHHVP